MSAVGPGWLVLVVGPSGAGKDTLIREAGRTLAGSPNVVFPTRAITRAPDATEDCETLSAQAFADARAAGAFALHWRAHGLDYGIPTLVDGTIRAGGVAVVNVSRGVIPAARARYANVFVVLIDASAETRAGRLAARERESRADIEARLSREVDVAFTADLVIVNEGPVTSTSALLAEAIGELASKSRAAGTDSLAVR
jgi:ribose 1,5-bisphosphokinase